MEDQPLLLCSTEVAAFVDALETISNPKSQSKAASKGENERRVPDEFIYENSSDIKPSAVKAVTKMFRINPKQQKEIIEDLFEKQKAVVTERSFMNLKGTKRFKSDVWSWFGDIKLLISSCEAKKLNISFYIKYYGGEQMLLSKMFVACFKCTALFIHDSQKSGTSTLRSHMKVCSRPKSKRNRHSPTIIFFPNNRNETLGNSALSDCEKHSMKHSVLNFFLSSENSFDFIENAEFQKLLQMCIDIGATYGDVNVNSMLCPQEKISYFLLNDMYVTCMNKFYTEFQYVHGASYFANIWEDENKQSYISLICYFSTLNGEMKQIIVHTDEFSFKNERPKDVEDWFLSFLNSQPVVPLKRLILTDVLTTSCMVNTFADEHCIRCAVQTLNSILNKVFKGISGCKLANRDYLKLVNKCVELVSYLEHHSFKYKISKLENSSLYKWQEVLNLLKSINKYYGIISSFLNDTGDGMLLHFGKNLVSEIVNFFQLFETAIEELSLIMEPTMNIYVPWITELRKQCLTDDRDSNIMLYFKRELCHELNGHLNKHVSVYHRVATLLDPRFKKIVFLPHKDHITASIKIKNLVKECIEALHTDELTNWNTEKKFTAKEKCRLSSTDGLTNEKNANTEVEQYLFEPFYLVNQDNDLKLGKFNPLKYWIQNSDKYPYLTKVAMWILSCPVSCKTSEETFVKNNWFINHFRVHMHPEHINKILFIKSFKNV